MNEHNSSSKRTDPMGLVVFVAMVAVLIGATYMLAQNISAEGEAIRARIDAVSRQSTAETQELRSMIKALKQQSTAVAAAPAQATQANKIAEAPRATTQAETDDSND